MADRETFDHYEILTRDDGSPFELGRGAMGITFKAFDTNLRFPVALKVINEALLDSEGAKERFISEARAAALLRHRNVASVFHLGIDGQACYYAMEYVDGETVDALVKREGPLTPRLALQLATQVARALGAAQKQHLVHRDIKPSNLMLVHEDEELCVKVIDFGLAKSLRHSGEETPTIAGFVGTPHYASPEQLEEKEIDVRTDIYSLGATLWFMLTGEPPFTGSVAKVISSQLESEPPFDHLASAPPCVTAILRRMLEKSPANRPQTPADLRRELEEALAALPADHETTPGIDMDDAAQVLENDAQRESDRPFRPGETAVGHYEVLEDLGEGAAGDLFKARDGKDLVRLMVVSPALIEDHDAYTRLEHDAEQISALEHPNVLTVRSLERTEAHTLLVLEWVQGFSLVDLLRARRELEPEDALPIIGQAAAGADFAASHNLARVDFALHHIFVHFPTLTNAAEAEALLRRPVSEWPEFQVKLNPLGLTRELSLSDTWAGGQTIVGGATAAAAAPSQENLSTRYVQALGAVAYELLGGTPAAGASGSSSAATRYVPLATLSEEGNAVLKRTADPTSSFASCEALHKALTGVERDTGRASTPAPSHPTPAKSAAASTAPPSRPAPARASSAASTAPAGAPPSRERTEIPAPAKPGRKLWVLGLAGGAMLLILAVGVVALMPLLTSRAPEPTVTQPPVATPAPTVQPTPAPAPTRQELLRQALDRAQQDEVAGNWAAALAAYLSIAKGFPESETGRVRLELVLERLRTTAPGITPERFRALREHINAAAKLGVVSAMMILAEHLRAEDPTAAFNWYCAAAAEGAPHAHTQIGLMYSNGAGVERDLEKAAWWFQQATDRGDAPGIHCLGECYLYGKGVPKDLRRAVELLEKAAAAGVPEAMNRLGTMYQKGEGVPENFAEAFRLFSEARKQGNLDALGNLGVLYHNGQGVPMDKQKAVSLFRDGAQKGNAYCIFRYAFCLENGIGLPASKPQAEPWYRRAAEAGFPPAIDWCKKNGVTFTPASP